MFFSIFGVLLLGISNKAIHVFVFASISKTLVLFYSRGVVHYMNSLEL